MFNRAVPTPPQFPRSAHSARINPAPLPPSPSHAVMSVVSLLVMLMPMTMSLTCTSSSMWPRKKWTQQQAHPHSSVFWCAQPLSSHCLSSRLPVTQCHDAALLACSALPCDASTARMSRASCPGAVQLTHTHPPGTARHRPAPPGVTRCRPSAFSVSLPCAS